MRLELLLSPLLDGLTWSQSDVRHCERAAVGVRPEHGAGRISSAEHAAAHGRHGGSHQADVGGRERGRRQGRYRQQDCGADHGGAGAAGETEGVEEVLDGLSPSVTICVTFFFSAEWTHTLLIDDHCDWSGVRVTDDLLHSLES